SFALIFDVAATQDPCLRKLTPLFTHSHGAGRWLRSLTLDLINLPLERFALLLIHRVLSDLRRHLFPRHFECNADALRQTALLRGSLVGRLGADLAFPWRECRFLALGNALAVRCFELFLVLFEWPDPGSKILHRAVVFVLFRPGMDRNLFQLRAGE